MGQQKSWLGCIYPKVLIKWSHATLNKINAAIYISLKSFGQWTEESNLSGEISDGDFLWEESSSQTLLHHLYKVMFWSQLLTIILLATPPCDHACTLNLYYMWPVMRKHTIWYFSSILFNFWYVQLAYLVQWWKF